VELKVPHYAITVIWSDEDECWVANIPDLTPCSAFGTSPDAAVREVCVAMEGWLEAARANNFPIPESRYQPRVEAAE
jgi:predicted RNase H-like HicB family nuclease